MKPVRILPLCITLALVAVMVSDAVAQNSLRGHSVRSSERAARASWQPTRAPVARQVTEQPSLQDSQIRTVEHVQVEGLPAPPPDAAISIVEPPVYPGQLDGQVTLAPIYEGELACDAYPGACGCGDPVCVGCDSIGCDGGCGASCCGELCGGNAWRPCITLCLPQDGWASFEFLGWFQKGMYLPPLVTTSIDPDVPRQEAGVIGEPSTRILLGNQKYLDEGVDGGRLRFGLWLDRCHTWGVGAEYFELSTETEFFSASSDGNPILARPFFNTQTGLVDSELVAFPDVLTGTVTVAARTELVGGGVSFRKLRQAEEGCSKWFLCGCPEHFCSRTELSFGYRYLQLKDGVVITEDLVSTDTANPGSFQIYDAFTTTNQFNGFDVGYLNRRTRGRWSCDVGVRLAIGNTRQTVRINGQTTVNDPNTVPNVNSYPGGLLTQTSNIGSYTQDQFAIVPELDLKIGYQLTKRLRVTLGYTGIYWSNVVRPGEQIDLDVNPTLIPPSQNVSGVQRPRFAFDTIDYWAEGINFGGEFRW